MSEPAKAPAKGEEKTLPAKLLAAAIVAVALVVAAYFFGGFAVPEFINATSQGFSNTGKALNGFGQSERIVAQGLDSSSDGFREIGKSLAKWLATIVILAFIFYIFGLIMAKMKKDEPAPPKKEKKAEPAKADDKPKADDKAKADDKPKADPAHPDPAHPPGH